MVLPQAFRNMLPVLLTQTIILFQDTSLVYAIGAYDLLKGFEVGRPQPQPPGGGLPAGGRLFYFVICFSLSLAVRQLQKRIANHSVRFRHDRNRQRQQVVRQPSRC